MCFLCLFTVSVDRHLCSHVIVFDLKEFVTLRNILQGANYLVF